MPIASVVMGKLKKNRHMRKIQFILIFILISIRILGQERLEKLDNYLTNLEKNDSFSGVVIIGQNGEKIYSKVMGFADRDNHIKLNLNSQFSLSSTSKSFTAVCIMRLVQEGRISDNEKIGKYFPELDYGDKVTIHHLLTHSSGLTDFYNVVGFSYKNVKTCLDIIPYIKNQKLVFNPGDSVFYSTSGMILLGALIEKVSGQTYQAYVTENILKPLKMDNTSFVNGSEKSIYEDKKGIYSKGYAKDDKGQIVGIPYTDKEKQFIPLSAGGVWSSASDLLKFDNGINKYEILQKKYVDLMQKKYTYTGWPNCYFGYVWVTINSGKEEEAIGIAGNSPRHHSYIYHYKKDNKVIIIMTNYGFVDIFAVGDDIEKILYK